MVLSPSFVTGAEWQTVTVQRRIHLCPGLRELQGIAVGAHCRDVAT